MYPDLAKGFINFIFMPIHNLQESAGHVANAHKIRITLYRHAVTILAYVDGLSKLVTGRCPVKVPMYCRRNFYITLAGLLHYMIFSKICKFNITAEILFLLSKLVCLRET